MAGIVITQSIAGIATRTPEMPALPVLAGQLPIAPGQITVRRVLKVTAEHYGTTPDELVSVCRTQPLVRHRQVAMYVAVKMTGRELPFIAYYMGKRKHTTILHGEQAVKGLLDDGDAETVAAIGAIMERLQAIAGQLPIMPRRITIHRVLRATAEHYGTTPDELVSVCRTQPLVRRRQVAMYVAHKMTGRSSPFIAYYMGNRNHTTILFGVRAVKGLLDAGDAETTAAVRAIMDRLQVTRGRA
jgi:chromosomal replication initiation ATPase DnaA